MAHFLRIDKWVGLSGFADHPAVPGSSTKQTIYAFSIWSKILYSILSFVLGLFNFEVDNLKFQQTKPWPIGPDYQPNTILKVSLCHNQGIMSRQKKMDNIGR